MLTKSDLKAIEKVVSSTTDPKFESLDQRFNKIDRSLKSIRKDIKDLTDHVKFQDASNQETRKRVSRVEEHLGLPKT